jgi:chitodextrinase
LSSPLSCSTYKLAFSIPPDFQLPELELLLFVDGEATVRCNDRPLGKFGGFTQPPSVVKTKDRSYFVAGENLLEIEFRSDGGGDGVDFWGSVSYSQTNVMATPRCGYAPLFVEFGLDGLLALESAVWDFGDGATGAGLAPTHEYAAAGSYMIKVTAGLAGGGELSLDGGLLQVVAEAPHADFSVSSIPGASPLTLQLTDRSTGQITRHHWDFGDGMVSADPSPAHTFAQAGAYEVKLLVSGPCAGVPGNDASASRTVDVGILRKATLEQRGPSCVALVLESDVAITGGEIGIAYDPTLVVPVKVSAGADLPSGAEIHSDLHAEVNCDTASGVQAGLIAAWIHPLESGGGSTPPGRHQLLKVCFDPANGAPEDVCSALKFVTCLGVLAAPVRNVVTGPDGASIPVTTIDGDVCLGPELAFRRGDSTGDDSFDISDAIQVFALPLPRRNLPRLQRRSGCQ